MNVNEPNEACACPRYLFYHVKEPGCPWPAREPLSEERVQRFVQSILGWVADPLCHDPIEKLLRYQYEEVRRDVLGQPPALLKPKLEKKDG